MKKSLKNKEKPKSQRKIRVRFIKNAIRSFKNSIANIKIDDNFSTVVDCILNCKNNCGKIIFCGMGKAGNIGQKSASTFCSLGVPSVFLHPGEASHGNIGILSSKDILFVLSTSGKTRETIETISLAKRLGVYKVLAITSKPKEKVGQMADIFINAGVNKEFSLSNGFNLAPTNSTLVILAILDSIALVCASELNFNYKNYSLLHHSGYLGQIARKKLKGR